jgi:hypothetical protein
VSKLYELDNPRNKANVSDETKLLTRIALKEVHRVHGWDRVAVDGLLVHAILFIVRDTTPGRLLPGVVTGCAPFTRFAVLLADQSDWLADR